MKIFVVVVVLAVVLGLGSLTRGSGATTATVGGLVKSTVGVVGGLGTDVVLAGTVGKHLNDRLTRFTKALNNVDATGKVARQIKTFATGATTIAVGFNSFTGSGSDDSTKVSTTGHGSIDFARVVGAEMEKVLQSALEFTGLDNFNIKAMIGSLIKIIRQLTVVFGKIIIGALEELFDRIVALTQEFIKAIIAQDFQSLENTSDKILYILIVFVDLFVNVSVNISDAVKGSDPNVTGIFTVAVGLLTGVISVVFTALHSAFIAAQGTVHDKSHGDANVYQAVTKALYNVIGLSGFVVQGTAGFISSTSSFIKNATNFDDNFSIDLYAVVSVFFGGFAESCIQTIGTYSSVTNVKATVLGEASTSYFKDLDIRTEAIRRVTHVANSNVGLKSGIFGLSEAK